MRDGVSWARQAVSSASCCHANVIWRFAVLLFSLEFAFFLSCIINPRLKPAICDFENVFYDQNTLLANLEINHMYKGSDIS